MTSERLSDGWVHRLALEPGLRPYANDAHDLACEVEVLRAENAELRKVASQVAQLGWGTSCTEAEHTVRIYHMERLRQLLRPVEIMPPVQPAPKSCKQCGGAGLIFEGPYQEYSRYHLCPDCQIGYMRSTIRSCWRLGIQRW
jgi:hypothetical protein